MQLFRQAAIDGQRRKLYGNVFVRQPLGFLYATTLICIFTVGALVYISVTRLQKDETAPGWIIPELGLAEAFSPSGLVVSNIPVHVGQRVMKGQIVATMSNEIFDGSGNVASQQKTQLEAQIGEINAQLSESRSRRNISEAKLSKQITLLEATAKTLLAQRVLQDRQIETARQQIVHAAPLVEKGYISKFEQDRRQQAMLAMMQSLSAIDGQIKMQEIQLTQARADLAAGRTEEASEESKLRGLRANLIGSKAALSYQAGATLRAPIGGVVISINLQPGETARAGRPVVVIAPEGRLAAELLLATRSAGFVKVGQEVRVRVDAFPHQRYGWIRGYVDRLNLTGYAPDEFPGLAKLEQPAYRIRVRLDAQGFDAYGSNYHLQPGMTLSANIVTQQQSILQWLFDPVLARTKTKPAEGGHNIIHATTMILTEQNSSKSS